MTNDSAFGKWAGRCSPSLVEDLRRLADDLENVDRCLQAREPQVAMNSWTLGKRAVPCLIGRSLGHPHILDGRPAFSSELFHFDPARGVARTMSRWYRLGTRVEPEYWGERFRGKADFLEDSL